MFNSVFWQVSGFYYLRCSFFQLRWLMKKLRKVQDFFLFNARTIDLLIWYTLVQFGVFQINLVHFDDWFFYVHWGFVCFWMIFQDTKSMANSPLNHAPSECGDSCYFYGYFRNCIGCTSKMSGRPVDKSGIPIPPPTNLPSNLTEFSG